MKSTKRVVRTLDGLVAELHPDGKAVKRLHKLNEPVDVTEDMPDRHLWLPAEETFGELPYGYSHGPKEMIIRDDRVTIHHPAELKYKMTSLRDPTWASDSPVSGVTPIHAFCTFEHLGDEVVHFGADPTDPEPHGRDIYARLLAGEFGPIAPFAG